MIILTVKGFLAILGIGLSIGIIGGLLLINWLCKDSEGK